MKIKQANKEETEKSLEIASNLRKWFTEEAIKKMRKTFRKNLIISRDKKVLGFLNYKINKNSATILWIGIAPDSLRRGIGTKLLKKLEKIARNKRMKKLRVETLTYEDSYKPYKLTRNFYLKNGFLYKWIRKAKEKSHDDLVIMEKILK